MEGKGLDPIAVSKEGKPRTNRERELHEEMAQCIAEKLKCRIELARDTVDLMAGIIRPLGMDAKYAPNIQNASCVAVNMIVMSEVGQLGDDFHLGLIEYCQLGCVDERLFQASKDKEAVLA